MILFTKFISFPKAILFSFLFLFHVKDSIAQQKIRTFIPISFDAGAALSDFTDNFSGDYNQKLGYAISLSSGIMFRFEEKFGLSVGGGLSLLEYGYTSQSSNNVLSYNFAFYCPNVQISPFIIIPIEKNPHSEFRFQTTLGYHFIGNDQKSSTILDLQGSVRSVAQNLPYIKPEIGLTKFFPKMQLDLGLSYHYNMANNPVLLVNMTNAANNTAEAQSRINYLALTFRVSPEVNIFNKSAIKKKIVPKELIAEETLSRSFRERLPFDFKRKKVVIKVWDNSEIDGDIISIALNGEYILREYTLKREKKKLKIRLQPGENELLVEAHNVGSVPPNTAAVSMRQGFKKYFLVTSTNLQRNEVLKLRYLKK